MHATVLDYTNDLVARVGQGKGSTLESKRPTGELKEGIAVFEEKCRTTKASLAALKGRLGDIPS